MPKSRSKGTADRTQTDESLRTERLNLDRVLIEKQAAVEHNADQVVDHARDTADAVLQAARDKADEQVNDGAGATAGAALTEEREQQDEALKDERAAADENLDRERRHTAHALLALLPIERDATDRYLLTERVRSDAAVSNRDDFLGIVSHDLRDLLGGIVMSAALLAERAADTEEGKQIRLGTERIQRYAARMNRLIGDLVDVASIDAGKLAVSSAAGDVGALIGEAADTFREAAVAKGLSLVTDVAEGQLTATFDHDRLLQVLANLVTNAIKFTPAGGTIRIVAERAGDGVQVSVSDTGEGIPAELIEAVFERFRQVAEKDRRGLGLGLYISKCLVEAHRGRMWAESTLGAGTTVRFTIP